jgi:hypothetical protein
MRRRNVACNNNWNYAVTCNTLTEVIMVAAVTARVQKTRNAMRAAGLRPVQIWVPDTRRPGFAEECRRQSLLLRDDPLEAEVLEWIEENFDNTGWTA